MEAKYRKELVSCWKYYRGEQDGYLLTAKEAWSYITDYIRSPYRQVETSYDAVIYKVWDDSFCRRNDC